jgi:D-glycero-D-manno-heptose 1,7-bisphosphate phosphatase
VNRAIFLDRDGVINRKAPEGSYVTRWEDFEFLPGIVEAIAEINKAGLRVIVISNQRCVAKGLITIDRLGRLHQQMSGSLAECGARIDAIYYCPHDIDARCRCRKPEPGMIQDAGRDHQIELADSWMVGDSELDIQAGKRAGCKTALVLNAKGNQGAGYGADFVGNRVLDVVMHILDYQGRDAAARKELSAMPTARTVKTV